MKRKVTSMFLAMAMCVTMIGSAAAVEDTPSAHTTDSATIQEEIDARLDIIMDDVYLQLEAQDALVLLDVYEEYFLAEVTCEVMSEYGIEPYLEGKITYTLENGGAISYLSSIPNAQPTEVLVTCLERQRTLDYILDSYSFSINTIIETILGGLGSIGDMSGPLLTMNSIVDSLALTSIDNANGYTKIVNTYSREYGTTASVVRGWDDPPFVVTPSNSYDHHIERFPEYVEGQAK